MKPIHFKEVNVILAKEQPEYLPLPVFHCESKEGEIISCWRLSLFERLKVLITGRLWFWVLTFNSSLQPQLPSVDYPFQRKENPHLLRRHFINELRFLWLQLRYRTAQAKNNIIGEWRLLWGFCPVCNSDAPKKDNCAVCSGYGNMHCNLYPPAPIVKQQWRKRWKHD